MLSSRALNIGRAHAFIAKQERQQLTHVLQRRAFPIECCRRYACNGLGQVVHKHLLSSSLVLLRRRSHYSEERFVHRKASSSSEAQSFPEDDSLARPSAHTDRHRAWDLVTQKMTELSVFFFVLLMMPQLIKNAGYLKTKQFALIGALPWMGYTTGLMGNMLLLTYFTTKKEGGAMTVQAVGVIATYLLLTQIYAAGYMPIAPWAGLSVLVLMSLLLNYFSYAGMMGDWGRSIWMDFQGGVGWAVLAQVVLSSFSVSSVVPGLVTTLLVAAIIILRRLGKLSEGATQAWEASSAWIATLLFMFMPVPQLILNLTQPSSLAGLSASTNFLAMAGNCFMIPRALFLRDTIWLVGSSWGALVMGWGIIFSLYRAKILSRSLFVCVTVMLAAFIGGVLFQDANAR